MQNFGPILTWDAYIPVLRNQINNPAIMDMSFFVQIKVTVYCICIVNAGASISLFLNNIGAKYFHDPHVLYAQ